MLQRALPFPTLVPVDAELIRLWRADAAEKSETGAIQAILSRASDGIEIQRWSEARTVLDSIRDLSTRGEFLLWQPTLSQIASEVAELLPHREEPRHAAAGVGKGTEQRFHSVAAAESAPIELPTAAPPAPSAGPVSHASAEPPLSPAVAYLAGVGAQLHVRTILPHIDPAAALARARYLQTFDVVWIHPDGRASAFLLREKHRPLEALLMLADVATGSPDAADLYLVGEESDRAPLEAMLQRPSLRTLDVASMFRFLSLSDLRQRLDRIGDLTPYLRPAFLEHLSSAL